MSIVARHEIVDYVTYEEQRSTFRPAAMAAKGVRRIHVGPVLTFLFENRTTVRYQVQEMMRTERIVKEADILHELQTYNELLGETGQLGASLLIGIDDPAERDVLLVRWLGMQAHWYLRMEDGRRVQAMVDPRQVGETRLSSVQYLLFDAGGQAPVAVGCDHPDYTHETTLTAEQRAALAEDAAA